MAHLLDHLVPAFGGDVYGGALDGLPLGVWLRSGILPMKRDGLPLFGPPALQRIMKVRVPDEDRWRQATSDDFRYRVVVISGQRRVERANVVVEGGVPHLEVGAGFLSSEGSNLLPRVQHAAFSNNVSVDPKQDWRTKKAGLDFTGLFDREIKIAIGAVTVVGGYMVYRRLRRKG